MSTNGGDSSREKGRPQPDLDGHIQFQPLLDMPGLSDDELSSTAGPRLRVIERKMAEAQSTLERARSAVQKAELLQRDAADQYARAQAEFQQLRKQVTLELAQSVAPEYYTRYLETHDQELLDHLNESLWSQVQKNAAVQDALQAVKDAHREHDKRVYQRDSSRRLVVDSNSTYERYWGEREQLAGRSGIHTNTSSEPVQGVLSHVFKRSFSEHDIGRSAGARAGDTVTIVPIDRNHFRVNLALPNEQTARFDIERLNNGDIVARNPFISVRDPYEIQPSTEIGIRILDTFCAWQEIGVRRVYARATSRDVDLSYILLARLRFDGPIPEVGTNSYGIPTNARQEAQDRFGPDISNVRQVWTAPGGQRWWTQHGVGWDAMLDLTPGSRMGQQLDRFRRLRRP